VRQDSSLVTEDAESVGDTAMYNWVSSAYCWCCKLWVAMR